MTYWLPRLNHVRPDPGPRARPRGIRPASRLLAALLVVAVFGVDSLRPAMALPLPGSDDSAEQLSADQAVSCGVPARDEADDSTPAWVAPWLGLLRHWGLGVAFELTLRAVPGARSTCQPGADPAPVWQLPLSITDPCRLPVSALGQGSCPWAGAFLIHVARCPQICPNGPPGA